MSIGKPRFRNLKLPTSKYIRPENPADLPASRTRFRHALNKDRGALVGAGHLYSKPQKSVCIDRILPDYALVYVTGGGGHYSDHISGDFKIKPGDLIVLFPGMPHTYYPTPEWHESFLVFQGNVFQELERACLISRNNPVLSPGLERSLISAFDSLIHEFLSNELPSDAILTARIHMLLAEISDLDQRARTAGDGKNFARAATALLEERLESELDLDAVARNFHLSYERFRKRFAEEVGVSPARYRMLRRIDKAKALLADGQLPVKAVAERLGYCDMYFFCRQFKQVTHQTPAGFRRAL
jgi:AraC-like DNA-binding protein